MKIFWILLFVFPFVVTQEMESVTIYRVEESDRLKIFAKNENIYPVTIEIKFDLKNLKSSRYLPYTGVLGPSINEHILDLKFTDITKGWDYETTYKFYMGNIFARHDDNFAYRLPFKSGEEYLLAQGFEGSYSHQGDLKYSLDFNLSVGHEVYAARGGTVVAIEESNNRGGPLRQYMEYANYITIMHDDGTFADYSHLMKNGAKVEIGEMVEIGQLIGYSGDTGYASGPHLHFAVKKAKRGGGYTSIPVKFATKDGIVELQEGQSYLGY